APLPIQYPPTAILVRTEFRSDGTHFLVSESQHFGRNDQERSGGNSATRFSLSSGQHYGKEDRIHSGEPRTRRVPCFRGYPNEAAFSGRKGPREHTAPNPPASSTDRRSAAGLWNLGQVPQHDGPIVADRGEEPAVRAERQRTRAVEEGSYFSVGHVPQLDTILAARGEGLAIRAERQRTDLL